MRGEIYQRLRVCDRMSVYVTERDRENVSVYERERQREREREREH